MNVFLYAKHTDNTDIFDPVIYLFKDSDASITISIEGRRVFRELDRIILEMDKNDITVVGSLSSLGLSDADIANRLDWFCRNQKMLVICDYKATYEYGIAEPMNMAVLQTILQSVLKHNGNVIEIPENRRSNSGRNRISFPDGWEDMYLQWEKGELSSKDFISKSGLKKATFYNLLTEYKALQASLQELQERYRLG